MSRCTACNRILTKGELSATNPFTNEPEDICKKCLSSLYQEEDTNTRIDPDDITISEVIQDLVSHTDFNI